MQAARPENRRAACRPAPGTNSAVGPGRKSSPGELRDSQRRGFESQRAGFAEFPFTLTVQRCEPGICLRVLPVLRIAGLLIMAVEFLQVAEHVERHKPVPRKEEVLIPCHALRVLKRFALKIVTLCLSVLNSLRSHVDSAVIRTSELAEFLSRHGSISEYQS